MKEFLRIPSPVGNLRAALTRSGAVAYLGFEDHEPRLKLMQRLECRLADLVPKEQHVDALRAALAGYFSGQVRIFDLPLEVGGTPFQRRVWSLLPLIPYGQRWTYGRLAEALGDVRLARAVGAANGANPVSILLPCHRVIGQGGQLTGYAGGLPRKAALLELEASWRDPL